MRYKSYVATYAGNSEKVNRENYYLNGFCKENFETEETFAENKWFDRRNLYGLISGANSGDLGAELSYTIAGIMKNFSGEEFDDEYGNFFEFANSIINSRIFEKPDHVIDMDISTVYIKDSVAKVFNMGDVPVFLIKKDGIQKLTGDVPNNVKISKTYFDENGEIVTEVTERKTVPRLGVFDEDCQTVPYVSKPIKLKKKSYFLLCSKVVGDVLGQNKILEIMADKKIADKDKATYIIDVVAKEKPESDFVAEVIVATPGLELGYKDTLSLVRWVGVAAICGILWLTGPTIANGISNFVDSTKTFIENYLPEESTETKGPKWIPWKKEEPKKEKVPEESKTEQQSTTPKPSGSGTLVKPQVPNKQQQTYEETPVEQTPQIPVEKESSVELPIDFN